jgi:DNA-directed RNA polymerase subunit RPC12/RpoP
MRKVARMNTKETCSDTVLAPNCGSNILIKKKVIAKEPAFHAVMDIKQFQKIRS